MIAAARHYWNAIKPFIVEPIERELLREPMEAVLECIAAVAANEVGKEDEVRHHIHSPGIELQLTCNRCSCLRISLKRYECHLHLKRLPTLASVAICNGRQKR